MDPLESRVCCQSYEDLSKQCVFCFGVRSVVGYEDFFCCPDFSVLCYVLCVKIRDP